MADPIATVREAQQMLRNVMPMFYEDIMRTEDTADALDAVVAEIERQAQEIAALRADAERYRWLRDCAPSIWYGDEFLDAIDGKLDSAIDAAMKQEASIDTALVADEGRRP